MLRLSVFQPESYVARGRVHYHQIRELWRYSGGGGGGGRVHGQKATTRLGMQKPRITAIYEFLARSAAAILKGSILRETS